MPTAKHSWEMNVFAPNNSGPGRFYVIGTGGLRPQLSLLLAKIVKEPKSRCGLQMLPKKDSDGWATCACQELRILRNCMMWSKPF